MLETSLLTMIFPLLVTLSKTSARSHPQRSAAPTTLDFQKIRGGTLENTKRQTSTTGLVPLDQTTDKSSWISTIQVGTPPVDFNVIVDTGSSDLWLEGKACTACTAPVDFDASATSSELATGVPFTNTYGDGTQMTASIYQDVVSWGGLTFGTQAFGVAETLTDQLGSGVDGLFGIGLSYNSGIVRELQQAGRTGGDPFFVNLIAQEPGLVDVIGISLDTEGGSICLGCIDGSAIEGDMVWAPFEGVFEIAVTAISVNGVEIPNSAVSAIIDTGSTAIFASPNDLPLLYNQIAGASDQYLQEYGFVAVPCTQKPDIAFQVASTWVKIPGEVFGSLDSGDPEICIGGLLPTSSLPSGTWILGDVFLQAVYSVFDFGNHQMGFAQAVST